MKKTALKNIRLKSIDNNFILLIGTSSFRLCDIKALYRESKFYSFLRIESRDETFIVKGLRSFWELLSISTYDWSDKRDDNKIFDLYCRINDLKE